jgi:magnesium chelatase accessory protein
MSRAPDWSRDGADWPNRSTSRFVRATGLDWHVQRAGVGPTLLLLHGTGASTHSWGALLPLLAAQFDVIAPDLPGHGFTTARPSGMVSLPFMARAVAELIETLGAAPTSIVGHSAGAAVACRMVLDRRAAPTQLISINGALLPWPGMAQHLFPALAKLLFLNPFVPRLMSWQADDQARVDRMLAGTGSTISAEQRALYARLFRHPRHVEAALAMMANWDLDGLERDLPRLTVPLTLIAAENDRFTPPAIADRVARIVSGATVVRVPGLGHLAHEEDAGRLAALIRAAVDAG